MDASCRWIGSRIGVVPRSGRWPRLLPSRIARPSAVGGSLRSGSAGDRPSSGDASRSTHSPPADAASTASRGRNWRSARRIARQSGGRTSRLGLRGCRTSSGCGGRNGDRSDARGCSGSACSRLFGPGGGQRHGLHARHACRSRSEAGAFRGNHHLRLNERRVRRTTTAGKVGRIVKALLKPSEECKSRRRIDRAVCHRKRSLKVFTDRVDSCSVGNCPGVCSPEIVKDAGR